MEILKIDCQNLHFKFCKLINEVTHKYYENSNKQIPKSILYEVVNEYLIKNKSEEIILAIFCNLDFEINKEELVKCLDDYCDKK